MQEIILFLLHPPGGSNFHYSTRHGRDLTFSLNHQTGRHEVRVPLEEWRNNNFFYARNILDQRLTIPILFDVTDVVAPVAAPQPPEQEESAQAQEVADAAPDTEEAPRTIIMRRRTPPKGRKVNLNRSKPSA